MPDINYRLNIDTTQLANSMSEIRSQLNTGVAGGFGFLDTGRAALGGIYDFGGAASAAGNNMVAGLQNLPMPTLVHMDRGISFTPHYGVLNAQASLQAEWLGRFYGPAGVAPFTPPGVGPTEYHGYLMREHERKFVEAKTDAIIAGGGSLAEFAGGAVGGGVGGLAGKAIGAAIGTALGGPAGTMLGGFLGGVAGDIGGALLGSKVVGTGVEKVREARQMTGELGSIIDARRGLPLNIQRELASAALEVGHETGTDAQQVADILARMPQLGTMIPATNTSEFHDQLKSIVMDLKDFSSALHTSTSVAQQMMAHMERLGFRGAQGADFLIGQAGRIGMGTSPTQVYGMMRAGESMGIQAQIGMGFGGMFALDVAAEATHARLGREGLQMAGGVGGFQRAMEQNILGNAFSPMGMLQIAAAPPGYAVPRGLEETLDRGINNLMDDFPRRVMALQVGRGEAIRAEGRDKTIEMAKQDLRNKVDILSPLMGPNANESDRELLGRYLLMQQGMGEYQAKGAAYRYLNPNAQDVHGMFVSPALADVRRRRELDHAAYARSDEMEMRSKHPLLSLIPGVNRGLNRLEDATRHMGENISVREGGSIESHLRDYAYKMGVPYDASPETLSDVDAGVISAHVAAPGRASPLGREMATLASIMGGDGASVADMMHKSRTYSDALGSYGGAGETTWSARSLAISRQLKAEAGRDEAGFKRRLKGLADAIGKGGDVRGQLADVLHGTSLEAEARRGGLGSHAGDVLPVLQAVSEGADINLNLGKIMGSADLKGWVASEYERTRRLTTHGDKLMETFESVSQAGRRKPTSATGSSSEAMGDLANLIAKQNVVLDGLIREVRRSEHQNKRRSRATVGSN